MSTYITEEIIRETFKNKIKKYEKLHYRDFYVPILPENITLKDVSKTINIMIREGYTFLAAYKKYKEPKIMIMPIEKVFITDTYKRNPPGNKKLGQKERGIQNGIINEITINKNNILIDGYATYAIFRKNKEKFIPYKVANMNSSYTGSNKNVVSTESYTRSRQSIRNKLYVQQNGKCYICGKQTTLDINDRTKWKSHATVDHIIPLGKGGSNEISNCAIACRLCNHLKSDRFLTDELKREILRDSRNIPDDISPDEYFNKKKRKKKHRKTAV